MLLLSAPPIYVHHPSNFHIFKNLHSSLGIQSLGASERLLVLEVFLSTLSEPFNLVRSVLLSQGCVVRLPTNPRFDNILRQLITGHTMALGSSAGHV